MRGVALEDIEKSIREESDPKVIALFLNYVGCRFITERHDAVEALEAVKEKINIELDQLDVEINWNVKDVRTKVLEIIEEHLKDEST